MFAYESRNILDSGSDGIAHRIVSICGHWLWLLLLLPVFLLTETSLFFLSVLWHCWLGNRKAIRPVKNWMLVCWWWWFDWSFARLIAPVESSCYHHLHHPLLQWTPANPGSPGKWPLKRREREKPVYFSGYYSRLGSAKICTRRTFGCYRCETVTGWTPVLSHSEQCQSKQWRC